MRTRRWPTAKSSDDGSKDLRQGGRYEQGDLRHEHVARRVREGLERYPGAAAGRRRREAARVGFGGDERDREVLDRGVQGSGAIIAGRRTYDDSVPFWGAGGPHPPTRVFVVTHEAPDAVPKGGVYTFVTDGIESALEQAKAAAGDKNVHVMGGPDTGRQFIEAGLLDEIGVHLVPVLFGSGTRMFEHLGSEHVQLETLGVIETSAATHLRYRIVK